MVKNIRRDGMNKQLMGSILLAVFLAACSGKQVKEEPKAAVEDRSPSASTTTTESMKEAPTATTAPVTEQKMEINPLKDPNNILSKRSIYFDFDKYEVKAEYRPLVEAHARYLSAHADAKVMLQGNTDERGSREYNLALGQRRADAVKKMLMLLGAREDQIESVSLGEEKPRAQGSSEEAYAQNRRGDILYAGEY
jgi:peptidoglycan-associated lipoprotein